MQKVLKCDGKYALKISFNLVDKQKSYGVLESHSQSSVDERFSGRRKNISESKIKCTNLKRALAGEKSNFCSLNL